MRENRTSGSEGGEPVKSRLPYPYPRYRDCDFDSNHAAIRLPQKNRIAFW